MSIALHYSFRKIDHQILDENDQISEDSVEQIYLKACDLFQFPEWIFAKLRNLTHIVISSNSLQEIPSEIKIFVHLNYLDISENQLFDLPSELFTLTKLKYLDLSANYVAVIPKAIKNLKSLEVLHMNQTQITEVPEELTECKELYQVTFDECSRLFTIPKNLFSLPRLVIASCRKCSLILVPSIIKSNLCSLTLDGNQLLNSIPEEALKFLAPTQSSADFYMIDKSELETLTLARTDFLLNSNINFVKLHNGAIASVPFDFKQLFYGERNREIPSLQELCIRAIYPLNFQSLVPGHLSKLTAHPTAICSCKKQIFSEAHALFYHEKSRINTCLTITKYFCSNKCLKIFCDNKTEISILV